MHLRQKFPSVPSVSINGAYALSKNVIEIRGKFLSDGGSPVLKYAICLSNIHQNPTLETDYTNITTNSGMQDTYFKNSITDFFSPGVYYYTRVYCTNKYGTSYSTAIRFTIN